MPSTSRSVWLIPAAIIAAGVILAIAVFIIRINTAAIPEGGSPSRVTPVTPSDHIIGNPQAPVLIVMYSDIDSMHSKTMYRTLEQLMTEYAAGGQVAWVYRHFPITTEQQYSLKHAIAAECAASLGAPDSFWRFIDLLNAAAPSLNEFNPRDYGVVVRQLGIDETRFTECLNKGTFGARVRENTHNAIEAGALGAPYTVVLVKGSDSIAINGTLSLEQMREVVEKALGNLQK